MKTYQFRGIYHQGKWLCPAYVQVNLEGKVVAVSAEKPETDKAPETVDGYALPGIPNAHSHAFQYAMAGMAENFMDSSSQNDFWSWRKTMYHLATTITPEQMETVATRLYVEMLKNGYTSVAEFHYLHHQPNGKRYEDPIEMSRALIAAAHHAGIGLTLVPVHYRYSDFGQPALDEQRRFAFRDVDEYLNLVQELQVLEGADFSVGYGAHSLRAASIEDIQKIDQANSERAAFHLHIAEQTKEVDACLSFSGRRPVQYLMDQVDVGDHWHLVHATHIDDLELKALIQKKANVVLCPTTEANLGDGIFPLTAYHAMGGRWSIGSDSHVCRDPLEELRWLDYGQRLVQRKRNPLCGPQRESSGHELLHSAVTHGQSAMFPQHDYLSGRTGDLWPKDHSFDAVVFSAQETPFTTLPQENWVDALIFSSSSSEKLGVIRGGQWKVQNRQHFVDGSLEKDFQQCLKDLLNSPPAL